MILGSFVILVGDMSVGKSCLLNNVKGFFPTTPLPTIAVEFATKIIQLKEKGKKSINQSHLS